MRSIVAISALLGLVACDYDGSDFMPLPIDGVPGIVDLGEIEAVPLSEFDSSKAIYHTLGPPTVGERGGATVSFKSNGNVYCIVTDPEAVFWNQAVEPTADGPYVASDYLYDDGDIDLEVGLSAYYTGSPGLEMGTFEQVYEDSLGNEVTIEFNECTMVGTNGQTGAHAGRGAPESCAIDTAQHPDRSYTVVLNTWSLPRDDDQLSYAVAVVDLEGGSSCSAIPSGGTECSLTGEAMDKDYFGSDGPSGGLEAAFCNGTQSDWCAANPEFCGD